MSKGSKQRPTDKKRYDENYESINWNESKDESELTEDQMEELLDVVRDCPLFFRWPEREVPKKKDG